MCRRQGQLILQTGRSRPNRGAQGSEGMCAFGAVRAVRSPRPGPHCAYAVAIKVFILAIVPTSITVLKGRGVRRTTIVSRLTRDALVLVVTQVGRYLSRGHRGREAAIGVQKKQVLSL